MPGMAVSGQSKMQIKYARKHCDNCSGTLVLRSLLEHKVLT
jgi:hypothetical protein